MTTTMATSDLNRLHISWMKLFYCGSELHSEGFNQWFYTERGTGATQPRARHVSNWINPDSMPPPNRAPAQISTENTVNSPVKKIKLKITCTYDCGRKYSCFTSYSGQYACPRLYITLYRGHSFPVHLDFLSSRTLRYLFEFLGVKYLYRVIRDIDMIKSFLF